jgi:hypothetical protein
MQKEQLESNERSKTPRLATPFHGLAKVKSHNQNAELNFSLHIQLRAGLLHVHFLFYFAHYDRTSLTWEKGQPCAESFYLP